MFETFCSQICHLLCFQPFFYVLKDFPLFWEQVNDYLYFPLVYCDFVFF